MSRSNVLRLARPATFAVATLIVLLSCDENLPTGPDAFTARLEIGVTSDTIVVGDSSKAQARAIGPNNVVISGLTFNWTTSTPASLGLASSDEASARTRTFVAIKPGQSVVTLALPDKRFTTTSTTRTETIVVGGVKVLSSRDSTLSAINDTAVAIATSLVKANGALVNRASQGIRWIHQGTRTTVVGAGDTIRYIARANGADTLIATHDFCLKSAKCADTVVARVSQTLTMSLSTHAFQVWSFSDSVGPAVTLADRRGNGLAGTSVRFIPIAPADSLIVKVAPPVGTSNPTAGLVAAPRLVSIGNGTARVIVRGLAPDGFTIIATDTITETVRQVARRVIVEPQRATLSVIDFIPYIALARDARGAIIDDATVTVTSSGTLINATSVGPNPTSAIATLASITPTLTGIALPENNPLAPQDAVIALPSFISLVAVDTAKAGTTSRVYGVTVLDSIGAPASGALVRFFASGGVTPSPSLTDVNGTAFVNWVPPDIAGSYTLTGVRDTPDGLATLNEPGRVVLRRSMVVVASVPDAVKSSASVSPTSIAVGSTATVTVTLRDFFNNLVTSATSADFVPTPSQGTVGAWTCTNGVCTATYTAAAPTGPATITVKIGGVDVTNSPLSLTITP